MSFTCLRDERASRFFGSACSIGLTVGYPVMWLMLVPVSMCAEAVWHDLKSREIPDNISIRLLVSGLLATALTWHSVTFLDALLGVVIGFVAIFPFTYLGGIGAGDLKLVASLGAWLGAVGALHLFFWMAISGMAAALMTHLRRRTDFPYAPAILSGLLITVLLPDSLPLLIEWLRT